MLSVKNLVKVYKSKKGENDVVALNNVSIDFPETGLVFLLGKSGSGKSTLLNAIGGLDSFDSGEIIIKGKSSKDFSQSDFDSYRNTFIGFIFQEYNILENFTVQKNLALAIELQGKKVKKQEVEDLLTQVDMLSYAKRKPNQLSGGQKQRVAIARALIKNPEIIMADEPTGALDSATGKQVMETLKKLSQEKLVIIVSHDQDFAETYGDRIIELKDGKIISDRTKKEVEAKKTESGISIVDDKYIHIKKGQKLSQSDVVEIARQIVKNSENSDTIISLDKESNEIVKKTQGIADNGNQETFLQTEKEDIKTREYNSKDLKLIKSRLKFSDSFKMGASSLKSKVSKLVFTVILAVFAFTLFGVVDAFSCWNRASSTWQAIESTGQTNIAGIKEYEDDDGYSQKALTSKSDITELKTQFSDYVIKGVVGNYYSSLMGFSLYNSSGSYVSLTSSNSYLWDTRYSGILSVTETELQTLGFELEGNLPENDDEICIPKHLWECIKKSNSEVTDWQGYQIMLSLDTEVVDNNIFKIVGIIDDGTDLSKYEEMTDSELSEYSYTIYELLYYGWTNLIYVNDSVYQTLYEQGSTSSSAYIYYIDNSDEQSRMSYSKSWFEFPETEYEYFVSEQNWGYSKGDAGYVEYSKNDYIKCHLTYYKGGDISAFTGLSENEILLPYYFGDWYIDNIEEKIEAGLTIKIGLTESTAVEYKVVGLVDLDYLFFNEDFYEENIAELFKGYGFVVTKLNGSSLDKSLVETFETYNDDGVRYTIQNETTDTMDMFESLLTVMTSALIYVAIALAVFAGLLLINFISTSISYKKREIGVLRALGARGSDVFGIFFNESMVIAFINFAISAILSFFICGLVNQMFISEMGVNIYLLSFSIRQVLLILGVSVIVAFLASLIPVTKISRKKPIDAINNR